MNEQTLFNAIGGVEDSYLLELEQHKVRSLPKHFGLIAAMLALFLTACAAPAILQHFDALQSGGIVQNEYTVTWDDLWEDPDAHFVKGNYIILQPNTVALNVTVSENAPESLEQPCLPFALLDHVSILNGTLTETSLSLEFSGKIPQYGQIRGIFYQQHVLPKDGRIEVENFVDAGLMSENMKTYGDISALEIEGRTCYPLLDNPREQPAIYTKHIFWSDGYYLYALKLPISFYLPVTVVEDIVTSMTPVEDITEYLPAE